MSKLFRTIGVGANQQTEEVTNEKIRYYKSESDLDSDLANISDDEVIFTQEGNDDRCGIPLGTILAIHSNVVPYGYLPCNGVAFDENQYPALYALLGDNHTPYSYDKSRLGDYEEITISTDTNNPTVIEYDGYVKIIAGTSSGVTGAGITIEMYVNGNLASKYSVSSGSPTNFLATVSAEVKKGDEVYYKLTNMVITKTLARFYKHPCYIKATSGLTAEQQDYVLQSLLEADSYSTEEVATGKKWIDGKTIYRKVLDETFNATTSDTLIPNTSGLNIDSIVSSNWYIPSEKMYLAVIKLSVQNGSLYIRGGIAMGNIRNLVTVEYTKAD